MELVRTLLGWMESQERPFSVSTTLLAPAGFFFSQSVMPGRIELHFLRKTTPQATAGSILPDFTSIPEIKLSLSPWAVYFLPALSTLPLCADPE